MAEKVAGEVAVRAAAEYIYGRFADMTDAIRESLSEIKDAVGEVKTDVASVKEDVAGVKTDVAEVKASTEGLADRIDALLEGFRLLDMEEMTAAQVDSVWDSAGQEGNT